MSERKTAIAQFDWSLEITCPFCEHDIQLADQDDEFRFSRPLMNNQWEELKDMEIDCPVCDGGFYIEEVQH